MQVQGLALAVTAANSILLAFFAATSLFAPPAVAEPVAPSIRASVVELVDARGRVRSRLGVEEGGEVVLRLFDESGRVRVKLGASEGGPGH